jgi:mRNA interferase HigB
MTRDTGRVTQIIIGFLIVPNLGIVCNFDFNGMNRIFSKGALIQFWTIHPDAEQYLRSWYHNTIKAEWQKPTDVQKTFTRASVLAGGRVVFNINGNAYRIVVRINYERHWIFIRFIGTHKEYDSIDATKI